MTKQLHNYCAIVMSIGTLAMALPAIAQDEKKDQPASDRAGADRDRPERPRAGGADRARQRPSQGLLGLLDKNSDGELDKEELEAATASLMALDKNKDGIVNREELTALFRRGRPDTDRPATDRATDRPAATDRATDRPTARPSDRVRSFGPEQFAQMDTNEDGKISKDEAPERMRERWDRMDTSGDGFLDKAEQEAVIKFIRERMRNAGGGGGGRRDRADEGQGETDKPKRPALEE